MPSKRVAIALAGTMSPRHFGWPVWFEKATVLSDQVSQPRRCSGNSAAVLPTLPQATQDWTESTVGISGQTRIRPVEHPLDVEKDNRATDHKQAEPGDMHPAVLPGMCDKQPDEPDHRKERDRERQVLHVVDK